MISRWEQGSLVTVFGGSGFVGRHAVRALAGDGWRIRAATRRPDLAGHLQPMGVVGQIQPVQANLRYPDSVARAVEGAEAVVNLVGILVKSGPQTFHAVHVAGARAAAKAAREAGASDTILYSKVDFADEVKRLTDGRGVDVIYDSVGQTTFTKGLDCLRPRGTMVVYGQASGPVAPVDTGLLSTKGCLYLTRVNLGTYTATRQELEERSGDIFRWVGSGQLKLHVYAEFPLSEAAKAQSALEHRETTGKVLLVP